MIKIQDVTLRVVTDAEGIISITIIRTRNVQFTEPNPEDFDNEEIDKGI